MSRCTWAKSALAIPYHDREWGMAVHDDRVLFEFLILEGAQAGLSWETILKNARATVRRSTSGMRGKLPATTRARWRSCWQILASCATG